jgi:hypothetical protein
MKETDFRELGKEEIVRYLRNSIRSSFTNADFDWEFNTFDNKTVFKLYTFGDQVVASQAMLPVTLIVDGVPTATAKSETSYLSKDYRGSNHFENLYGSAIKESKNHGFQIIWGFTPAVKVWKTKLHFDVVLPNISEATITLSRYPSNAFLEKYIKNKILLRGKIWMFSVLRLFEQKNKYQYIEKGLDIKSSFPDHKTLKDFQNRLSTRFNVRVQLDLNEEYINWRIRSNPRLNYSTTFFYDSGKLVGYVIYSVNDGRLAIADLSYLTSSLGIQIVHYVVQQNSKNLSSVFYFGSDDSEVGKDIFTVFASCKAEIAKSTWANTVIKDISNDGRYKALVDPKGWHINGLWTEGFSI